MSLKLLTYKDGVLGATHVRGNDVNCRGKLPFLLGLLDLTNASKCDLPAIMVDEQTFASNLLIVVGEDQVGEPISVLVLDGRFSLLNLG